MINIFKRGIINTIKKNDEFFLSKFFKNYCLSQSVNQSPISIINAPIKVLLIFQDNFLFSLNLSQEREGKKISNFIIYV